MAKPFNPEESCSVPDSGEPRQFSAAMKEIFQILSHHNVVKPLQELCSRNEGVALSMSSIKSDDLMEAAYADY